MQCPCFARKEPLAQIGRVPQVQIAHLRSLDRGDSKETARRHIKTARLACRHQNLCDPLPACPGRVIGRKVRLRQTLDRIADHRRDLASIRCICRCLMGRMVRFHGRSPFGAVGQVPPQRSMRSQTIPGRLALPRITDCPTGRAALRAWPQIAVQAPETGTGQGRVTPGRPPVGKDGHSQKDQQNWHFPNIACQPRNGNPRPR